MKRSIMAVVCVLLSAACVPQLGAQRQPGADTCPTVGTLDPSAFRKYAPGACVTLVPPAAPKPEHQRWCPAESELPLNGNVLTLIGEVKTLLRRDVETSLFYVVVPDPEKGVRYEPLGRAGVFIVMDEYRLFRETSVGRYVCLVDTLVSMPE